MRPAGAEEFWAKVKKSPTCWLWTGCQACTTKYGLVQRRRMSRRPLLAHRYAWYLVHGEFPPNGLFVCHHCDVPLCVRPDHLFIGTHLDNQRDKLRKRRNRAPKGVKHGMAKLTEAQVLRIRASRETTRQLAKRYPVNTETIRRIRCNELWRHL